MGGGGRINVTKASPVSMYRTFETVWCALEQTGLSSSTPAPARTKPRACDLCDHADCGTKTFLLVKLIKLTRTHTNEDLLLVRQTDQAHTHPHERRPSLGQTDHAHTHPHERKAAHALSHPHQHQHQHPHPHERKAAHQTRNIDNDIGRSLGRIEGFMSRSTLEVPRQISFYSSR